MNLIGALLDLALPRRCVGCGVGTGALCVSCLATGGIRPVGAAVDQTFAAAAYSGAIRAALLAYKERGRRDLTAPLAQLLAGPVRAAADCGRGPPRAPAPVLVPVPSARSVAAARGGDHVLRIARRAAVTCGLRVVPDALELARDVRDSTGLSSDERAANLSGAMLARPAPAGVTAIVLDDIVTTGATLREARRALAAAGWAMAGSAVVAATERRRPAPIGSSHAWGLA